MTFSFVKLALYGVSRADTRRLRLAGAVATGTSAGGNWRDPVLHGIIFLARMLRLVLRGGWAGQAAVPFAGESALPN